MTFLCSNHIQDYLYLPSLVVMTPLMTRPRKASESVLPHELSHVCTSWSLDLPDVIQCLPTHLDRTKVQVVV